MKNNSTGRKLKSKTQSRGFSMIETLVAITVLTLAVTAPLTLAGQGLIAANYAKDQIVAFNLAQEAIELVRFHRDNQLIAIGRGTSTAEWLSTIVDSDTPATTLVQAGSSAVSIPFKVDTITSKLTVCPAIASGGCPRLLLDASTGFYTYTSGASTSTSRFTRTVYVMRRDPNPVQPRYGEALVRSVVTWQSGGYGTVRSVSIEDELFQWVPSQI